VTGMRVERFLAVRLPDRFVIVPLASIVRIEACCERVSIVSDRAYPHREALASLCARLPGDMFVRVHRSHAVNVDAIVEARLRGHGEYVLRLHDGSSVVTGRSYRAAVESALGLARVSEAA
jgi:two-component system, LytTR family, response regulator